jgi:NAD/NADP transhydrogenase alpha subunit
MSEIKRYAFKDSGTEVSPFYLGGYVSGSDYDALKSRLAEMKGALYGLLNQIEEFSDKHGYANFYTRAAIKLLPEHPLHRVVVTADETATTKEAILNRATDDVLATCEVAAAFKQPSLVIDALAETGASVEETKADAGAEPSPWDDYDGNGRERHRT